MGRFVQIGAAINDSKIAVRSSYRKQHRYPESNPRFDRISDYGIEMKNPWNRTALEQYLGKEESYTLEFKSSRPLVELSGNKLDMFFDDLSADVSAFLNAEGGLLIIGIEESKRNDKKPEVADRLSVGCPRVICPPSRLSSRICDRIHPASSSLIQVYSVAISPSEDDTLLAYVVEVKQGITAYQAADKRYYCRRTFGIQAMEDKEIRLRMLMDDRPRAEVLIKSVKSLPDGEPWTSLESSLAKFDQRRLKVQPLVADGPDPEAWSPSEHESFLDALGAAPKAVLLVRTRIEVAIVNIGNVTITRGAARWSFEPFEGTPLSCISGVEPFDFSDEDKFPLYPEMERTLVSFDIDCPRNGFTDNDMSMVTIEVYLDSGPPAREKIEVRSLIAAEIASANEKLAELHARYALAAPL